MNTSEYHLNKIQIFGIILIIINLICLIGPIFIRNVYEVLWVSHYVGLIEGIIILTSFKNENLNGMYVYLFIFQIGSMITKFFKPIPNPIDFLHVLYYFNHIPHILGFWMLWKTKYTKSGIKNGFIFLLCFFNLTWFISYFFNQDLQGINTVFSIAFIIVFILSILWFLTLIGIVKYRNKIKV